MNRKSLFLSGVFSLAALPAPLQSQFLTAREVVALPSPRADQRIPYGEGPLQFGELRIPPGPGPHPVAIVIHGGCWLSQYGIRHIGNLAAALTEIGFATWSIEYRRVGDPGGGWPGTFLDVAHGADHVTELADRYPLDRSRIVAVGHSAGGQLALWLAARSRISRDSPLYASHAVRIRGVLGLAAAADLALVRKDGSCDNVIDRLMGGSPEQVPDRYRQASPKEMVPLGVRQVLIMGRHDPWTRVADAYFEAAKAAGDDVQRLEAAESAHFEMIVPTTTTWPQVREAALGLLKALR